MCGAGPKMDLMPIYSSRDEVCSLPGMCVCVCRAGPKMDLMPSYTRRDEVCSLPDLGGRTKTCSQYSIP